MLMASMAADKVSRLCLYCLFVLLEWGSDREWPDSRQMHHGCTDGCSRADLNGMRMRDVDSMTIPSLTGQRV